MLFDILRLVSSITTILNGILLLILWIIAANDKGTTTDSQGLYYCRGCYWYYHNTIVTNSSYNLPTTSDPYPILIAFGVICGVLWMAIGGIGFATKTRTMAFLYTGLGIFNYLLFILLFAVICDNTWFYVFNACNIPSLGTNPSFCSADPGYWTKHQADSFDEFWGASLVAFILGAFQIGSGIMIINGLPIEGQPPATAYQSAPLYTNASYVVANPYPGGQPGNSPSNPPYAGNPSDIPRYVPNAKNPNQIPPPAQQNQGPPPANAPNSGNPNQIPPYNVPNAGNPPNTGQFQPRNDVRQPENKESTGPKPMNMPPSNVQNPIPGPPGTNQA